MNRFRFYNRKVPVQNIYSDMESARRELEPSITEFYNPLNKRSPTVAKLGMFVKVQIAIISALDL
jgi:hypothetical protein